MPRPGLNLTRVAFVNRNAKMVMRSGGIVFAVGFVISMLLGYSGSSRLASVGNSLLLLTLLGALVLLAVGAIIWLSTRDPGSRTRDNGA
jgi:ABC-type transporter Mla maintaining outer membrane lipid asymmetry permease subunit MlaE